MITPNYAKYFTGEFANRWVYGVSLKSNNSNIPAQDEQRITA